MSQMQDLVLRRSNSPTLSAPPPATVQLALVEQTFTESHLHVTLVTMRLISTVERAHTEEDLNAF